jgi:hypothetical protein
VGRPALSVTQALQASLIPSSPNRTP